MRNRLAILAAFVMSVTLSGLVTAADPVRQDLPVVFDASTARVSWNGGAPLAPAAGSSFATASVFLAGRGYDPRTLASLRVDHESRWRGISHLTLVQEVDGLSIAGAYAKFAFDETGALIDAIDSLVPVPALIAGGPAGREANPVGPDVALAAAMRAVIPHVADRPAIASRERGLATFQLTPAFYAAPTAAEILVARQSGRLERAWRVTTWTGTDNLLDVTVVDGAGAIAATERRTANDSYKIFPIDPGKGGQTTVSGPGTGNVESPSGWLSGNQTTIYIRGNNANAYLDRDANNAPDTAGGVTVSTSSFTASFDKTVQPESTASNKAVAVQNLFYLTNRSHDILYSHGFNEGEKNFQVNNFNKGGAGNDPVNAEAQDGSGLDNANMATPLDGSSPRMQMYLWSSPDPDMEVVVPSPTTTLDAYSAAFGPKATTTGLTGTLAMVNDQSGTTGDACEAMPRNSLSSKIAIVDRGACTFITKVKNVQAAGAAAVIVVNNVDGRAFAMGGSGTFKIPAVMVAKTVRGDLTTRTSLTATTRIKATSSAPVKLDGDLDSDIVYHEYAHGLTYRMIGGMSGPMAGAIGEGASDALAMFINGDDRIGEYASGDPDGIRSSPYAAMTTRYYSSMTGAEVHDDGEVYGRIAWLLLQGYGSANVSALLDTWVDGMNYTPSGPYMTDMRNGMLKSAYVRNKGTECATIRQAFAAAGVGDGASATVSRGKITATDSFTAGQGCIAP